MTAQVSDLQTPAAARPARKREREVEASVPEGSRKVRWRWGVFAALAMTLLSFYPQVDLWITLGHHWQGAFASLHYDEETYAAYINGLLSGRPRRVEPLARNEP